MDCCKLSMLTPVKEKVCAVVHCSEAVVEVVEFIQPMLPTEEVENFLMEFEREFERAWLRDHWLKLLQSVLLRQYQVAYNQMDPSQDNYDQYKTEILLGEMFPCVWERQQCSSKGQSSPLAMGEASPRGQSTRRTMARESVIVHQCTSPQPMQAYLFRPWQEICVACRVYQ